MLALKLSLVPGFIACISVAGMPVVVGPIQWAVKAYRERRARRLPAIANQEPA